MTLIELAQMKREGKKSVGVVAWDYQIARIADRAGVDIVSVGDSVGVNLWGHTNPLEVTMEEMLVVCKAVRRGVARALVSCDFPFGPLQEGTESAVRAAIRLVKEGGADMVKLDGASEFPDAVRAIVRAGIPVFAQFALTPQTALRYGLPYSAQASPQAQATAEMTAKLVHEAKLLEAAGASLLDFTNSGPAAERSRLRGVHSGNRRVRRRTLARRPDPARTHRDRLWGEMDRCQNRDLRQRCQDQPRCLRGADRGRARRPPDQGVNPPIPAYRAPRARPCATITSCSILAPPAATAPIDLAGHRDREIRPARW